jgi:mono/diheme cytochrome c family protein
MTLRVPLFLFAAAALAAAGCADDSTTGPDGSPSSVVFPTDSVSYQAHVQPLFNQACAFSGCHGAGGNTQSRLELDSYQGTLFSVPSVVIPQLPDQSELVLRIEGRIGQRMPINRNPLNQNQIQGIRKWIQEGARNN